MVRVVHSPVDTDSGPLPPRLAAESTLEYERRLTAGDGACGVHAGFGSESPRGLFHPRARVFLAETLGGTADAFRARMGDEALMLEFSSTLWVDILKPQAKVAAGLGGRARATVDEARWIRQRLERNAPDFWEACVRAVLQEAEAYETFASKRAEIVEAFRPLCAREMREAFLRPLLSAMDLAREYLDTEWVVQGAPPCQLQSRRDVRGQRRRAKVQTEHRGILREHEPR